MTTPVVYRVNSIVPSTVTEASELFAEQLEVIPYPQGFSEATSGDHWPPAGFTEVTSMTSATDSVAGLSLLPQGFDLSWVQGDTASFQFLFTDVLWTVEDPGETESLYNNDPVVITHKSLTSNVVTVTTSAPHNYLVGYSVDITGLGTPFDGTFTITAVPTSTSFSYAKTGTNVTNTADPGQAVISNMPLWVATEFAAQVRNPYIFSTYASDYWVPAFGYQYRWWRGRSIVAEFDCDTDIVTVSGVVPTQWATRVTLTLPADRSSNILPGNWYRWDLQTRTIENEVRTHLRGRVSVVTEWTVR